MDIRVGILGGTGGIGKWFAVFLGGLGYPVTVAGRTEGPSPERLAETSDVLIVSVPMTATLEAIARTGPSVRRGCLIMDLTSVKEEPVRAMLAASGAEVVGCHPLFGPSVPTISGQNVVLCPARGEKWFAWWKTLLSEQGASVTEMTPGEHDRIMALIQGANHFNSIAMAMLLRRSEISLPGIHPLTTPLFNAKMAIIERLLRGNHNLYADLLTQNPYVRELVQLYEEVFRELKAAIETGDGEKIAAILADTQRIV